MSIRLPFYEPISEYNDFCKNYEDKSKCDSCVHRLLNRCVKLTELGYKNNGTCFQCEFFKDMGAYCERDYYVVDVRNAVNCKEFKLIDEVD